MSHKPYSRRWAHFKCDGTLHTALKCTRRTSWYVEYVYGMGAVRTLGTAQVPAVEEKMRESPQDIDFVIY